MSSLGQNFTGITILSKYHTILTKYRILMNKKMKKKIITLITSETHKWGASEG